jgi:Zn-dependent oligopeptidase
LASYKAYSSSIRDVSSEAFTKLEAYQIEKYFRHDVYSVVKHYAEKHDSAGHTPEENRFLEKVMESFKRNGLDLEESKRRELEEVKKKISELCIKFQQVSTT